METKVHVNCLLSHGMRVSFYTVIVCVRSIHYCAVTLSHTWYTRLV